MASYDLKALHSKLLGILLAFDDVCRRHSLRYGICGGSLLGAVRHGGFIPWDDDLDTCMPRADYELLIANSRKWLPESYELICPENDPLYPLPFAKIQDASTTLIERRHLYYLGGCYIDIFPYDFWPEDIIAKHRQATEYEFLKQTLYMACRDPYRHGHGPSSWPCLMARRFYGDRTNIQRRIRNVLTRYADMPTPYASSYTDGLRGILPADITCTYSEYEFEGHRVMGIRSYDRYLRHMYGDYMQVPPPEKRIRHNFHYLDLDNPYASFKEE